jgi:response regulator RpfG family c-di-GMP phosphodiesterase
MFRSTYDVFTATNGHQALQIVAANQIPLVVSDQRMPEMLGIDLLSKVRELSPNTMRLLLTGYSDLAVIVGSVNDGEVFRFISKPWDQEDIKKTIAEAIEIALATWQTKPGTAASYTQEASNAATAKRKHELLIIDDNEMDREWISRLFAADYQTFAAGSITEAMSVLDLAVASAAKQHERLVTDPASRVRLRVVQTQDTEPSSLAKSIVRGLAGLSARFGLFGKRTAAFADATLRVRGAWLANRSSHYPIERTTRIGH